MPNLYNIISTDIIVVFCFDHKNYIGTQHIILVWNWAHWEPKYNYNEPDTGTIVTLGN